MSPELFTWLVSRGLGGQPLSLWWENYPEARKRACENPGEGHAPYDGFYRTSSRGIEYWVGRSYTGPAPRLAETDFEKRRREPDALISWLDVREVLCGPEELRQPYHDAYGAYVEQSVAKLPHPWIAVATRREQGLPAGDRWYFEDPENVPHWAKTSEVIGNLRQAGEALIAAGCELYLQQLDKQPVQGLLW